MITIRALAILYVVEVATEVAEGMEGNLSTKARKMKAISHLVVVKILEAEDGAYINNEKISLSISVIIAINMAISVMSVQLQM